MSATSQKNLRKACFGAVLRADTKLVILGSLPGERSLAERRYYAHPQNRFWYLIGNVIGRDLVSLEYEARLATLLDHGIGLWDTIASARREGSLDTAIREAEASPLTDLLTTCPTLRVIGFNGKKAWEMGEPQLRGRGPELIALPSSSPAHAAMPLAEKQQRWNELHKFLV
tara:strand:- start:89 stop:601 length:513 start_codon:yes stop_codon:yes gene_type:complete